MRQLETRLWQGRTPAAKPTKMSSASRRRRARSPQEDERMKDSLGRLTTVLAGAAMLAVTSGQMMSAQAPQGRGRGAGAGAPAGPAPAGGDQAGRGGGDQA